jgi:hypothetical protein
MHGLVVLRITFTYVTLLVMIVQVWHQYPDHQP